MLYGRGMPRPKVISPIVRAMAIVTKNSGSSSLLKGTLNDIGKLMVRSMLYGRGMPRPKAAVTSPIE